MPERLLLIPAAGVGERMKIGYPKQYFPLIDNVTMLEVTVNRLAAMNLFDRIAVVVSDKDSYIETCRFEGNVTVYRCGGETRAQSVLNGLIAAAPGDNDWVFVHDAARPCVEKDSVSRLIDTVENEAVDGAILAMPVSDTIKWVNDKGIIEKTIDRSRCYRAQTPQVFQAEALISALKEAKGSVTDEASAMEMKGATVKVVEGSAFNIKVTYPDDIQIVRNYLQSIQKGQEK